MKHRERMTPYLIGAGVAAVVLVSFGVPAASLVPYALVLACPLMMFFMMRGMATGDHGIEHGGADRPDRSSRTEVGSLSADPDVDRRVGGAGR